MTATVTARNTDGQINVPSMGTYPIAANTIILKGTIVTLNASAQATPGVDGEGFNMVGTAVSTVDNRTTAPSGGAAGAEDIEVTFGVEGWFIDGTTPLAMQLVYVVDNQTVSTSSAGGTRGVAGFVTEVRDDVFGTAQAYVHAGPSVTANAASAARGTIAISVADIRLATGAVLPAHADGVSDGLDLVDSEAFGLRFNDSVNDAMATSVVLPPDVDASTDMTLHVIGFRIGSADPTAALTIGAFFQEVGSAHTADSDAGGDTTVFDGATTIVTTETLTLAAADIPASPSGLTFTIVSNAALDADDLVVVGMWLEYTRKTA